MPSAETLALERQTPGASWTRQYVFTTRPRRMIEFEEICADHQNSPDSHFTRKPLCTVATASGRQTLAGLSLIEAVGGERTETVLAGEPHGGEHSRSSLG